MSDSVTRSARLRSAAVRIAAALVIALGASALGAAPAAIAAPCQTCPPPPPGDPQPHPPVPSQPTYRLTIDTVIAHQVEDSFSDELYIKVNGAKVYGPRTINELQGWFGVNLQKVSTQQISVALYDEDGPFDPDDSLGQVTFQPTGTGTQHPTAHLYGSGAHYELRTTLTRIS